MSPGRRRKTLRLKKREVLIQDSHAGGGWVMPSRGHSDSTATSNQTGTVGTQSPRKRRPQHNHPQSGVNRKPRASP